MMRLCELAELYSIGFRSSVDAASGFEAGWQAALEEAASHLEASYTNAKYYGLPIPTALKLIASDVRKLGLEEIDDEDTYDRESHGAGGDGSL